MTHVHPRASRRNSKHCREIHIHVLQVPLLGARERGEGFEVGEGGGLCEELHGCRMLEDLNGTSLIDAKKIKVEEDSLRGLQL